MHLNSSVAHTSNCFSSDGFPWAGDGAAGLLLLRFVRHWLLLVVAVLFWFIATEGAVQQVK
jgi:hypothetical protein